MLYPILPFYLQNIGYSVVFIGILEGIAEATAGLSKGYFGRISDLTGKRVPFVQIGYTLSAISKPLMALFVFPIWIFLVRSLDRLGKGVRTGARDSLLSSEAKSTNKGMIFGFHRSMDTFGAALGPTFALLYLYFYPNDYKTLFMIALFPGLLAIFGTLLLKERPQNTSPNSSKPMVGNMKGFWKGSTSSYKKIIIGLLFFTLFNSSDVFLLLKAKELGFSDPSIIGLYIFYNLVYASFAFPVGLLADKFGLKYMLVIGTLLFSVVYFWLCFPIDSQQIYFIFLIYGLYASATEGISKAWISNVTEANEVASAIGLFSGLQSVCLMISSAFAGYIWYSFGSNATFLLTSVVAVLVAFYFLFFVPNVEKKSFVNFV